MSTSQVTNGRPGVANTRTKTQAGRSHKSNINRTRKFTPRTNVFKTEDHAVIEIAVPGVTKEEVSIQYRNNSLEISFHEKGEDLKSSGERYTRREFVPVYNNIRIGVAKTYDASKIHADMSNGVLRLTLPKDQKLFERKSIEVK